MELTLSTPCFFSDLSFFGKALLLPTSTCSQFTISKLALMALPFFLTEEILAFLPAVYYMALRPPFPIWLTQFVKFFSEIYAILQAFYWFWQNELFSPSSSSQALAFFLMCFSLLRFSFSSHSPACWQEDMHSLRLLLSHQDTGCNHFFQAMVVVRPDEARSFSYP